MSKTSESRQIELVKQLSDVAEELGWVIVIPVNNEEVVPGLFMGTKEFVTEVTELFDISAEFEIFEKNKGEGNFGGTDSNGGGSSGTFH